MTGILNALVGSAGGSPPGAPTIGTASVASATSVSVPFTAPADPGVPAVITGYTVTSSPGGITATGSSSPIIVTGLTAGTTYTFTVTATNATGTGPASAASNSVTADSNPDAFSFTNSTDAGISTLTTSNTITPIGYNVETTWSVGSGGQGSVAGGAYATSGTISPGQTLTVRATSSSSYETATSHLVTIGAVTSTWSITTAAPAVSYTTAGTFSFVVPTGVTSVNMAAIGGGGGGSGMTANRGGGGGGGQLVYQNSIAVTSGETLTVTVAAGGTGSASGFGGCAGFTTIFRGGTILIQALGGNRGESQTMTARGGGYFGGGVGTNRRAGGCSARSNGSGVPGGGGGGAAAGWNATGARGFGCFSTYGESVTNGSTGNSGTTGGGGGGMSGVSVTVTGPNWVVCGVEDQQSTTTFGGSGGGGTGISVQGANGSGGVASNSGSTGGGGGSGGTSGTGAGTTGGNGGSPGGGGGGGGRYNVTYWNGCTFVNGPDNYYPGGNGGTGAARITWNGKTFPSNSG